MNNVWIDLLIVMLLMATIVFCWCLNKRLQKMREMGAELTPFMRGLAAYLNQISVSIDKLKQITDIGQKGLNEHIPTAFSLKDDFDVLLEHSERIAKRLDSLIEKAYQVERSLQKSVHAAQGQKSSSFSKATFHEELCEQNHKPQDIFTPSKEAAQQVLASKPVQRSLMSKLRGLR